MNPKRHRKRAAAKMRRWRLEHFLLHEAKLWAELKQRVTLRLGASTGAGGCE